MSKLRWYMNAKLLALLLLVLSLGCKRENDHPSDMSGLLSLSRQYFTDFKDGAKSERKYECAQSKFIYQNQYMKESGSVQYGDSALHHQFYFYTSYNPDEPLADFRPAWDGGKLWRVAGNAETKVPAFSTPAPLFPSFLSLRFDHEPVVSRSQPFTVSWDNTVPCDSFSIGLYQSHTYVSSGKVAGTISSYTFTPAQLSVFQNSYKSSGNVIIMEGWTYKNTVVSAIPVTVENYARRNCTVQFVD